ncbi:MAG: tRNA (adenosine(37)-N6)-threonylcarbamoyltransferase complex ATPase subunit type 1 TsaE [Puniceicoccaceae bacterium]
MMIDDDLTSGVLLRGPEATLAWGRRLGRELPPNRTVAVSGDLGDGKTTLCKGMAEGWGVAGPVKSPTYNYFLTYRGERGMLVHLDAYRLAGPADYASLLIEEILEEPWILLAEWPGRVPGCLPDPRLDLRLSPEGPHARRLRKEERP